MLLFISYKNRKFVWDLLALNIISASGSTLKSIYTPYENNRVIRLQQAKCKYKGTW